MQLTVELLDTEEENSDEPMEAEVRHPVLRRNIQRSISLVGKERDNNVEANRNRVSQ